MQDTLEHTDTLEIDKLNKEAWGINRKDAYKSIELSTLALEKSKKLNYKKGIALALKTLGTANIWISKNEEALNFSFEAISIFKEIDDKANEAETYYYVGASFRYLSDYDSAIKYYGISLILRKDSEDKKAIANSQNNIGIIYYLQGNCPKARALFENSLCRL